MQLHAAGHVTLIEGVSTYADRKLAGLCTRGRCTEPLAPDSQLCERHRREKAIQDGKHLQRKRANRRRRGLCAECPAKSTTYRCAACVIRRGGVPRGKPGRPGKTGVAKGVGHRAEQMRRDNDGKMRFRGQLRRGRQTIEALDDRDIVDVETEIVRAKTALIVVRSIDRKQRAAAEAVVLDRLNLVARFLDEILVRHKRIERPTQLEGDDD